MTEIEASIMRILNCVFHHITLRQQQQNTHTHTQGTCHILYSLPNSDANCVKIFLFTDIQGLKAKIVNKIPFINGLLTETSDIFTAFIESLAKGDTNSEIWILTGNTLKCERTRWTGVGVGHYIQDLLICIKRLRSSHQAVEKLVIKTENHNYMFVLIYGPLDARQ